MPLDTKDLYYSLQSSFLLLHVWNCKSRLHSFQTGVGLTVRNFMRVPDLYLKSLAVLAGRMLFTQKNGMCIGPAVTPFLSEIYLHASDLSVASFINDLPEGSLAYVKCFIDDLIITANQSTLPSSLSKVSKDIVKGKN